MLSFEGAAWTPGGNTDIPDELIEALEIHEQMRTKAAGSQAQQWFTLDSMTYEGGLETYFYDTQGNLVEENSYGFDHMSGEITWHQRVEKIWEGGLLMQETRKILNSMTGVLTNQNKFVYTYDDNGFLETRTRSNWNSGMETWTLLSQMEYENNANGLPETVLSCNYDSEGSCEPSSQLLLVYDEDNREIQRTAELWNAQEQTYLPASDRYWDYEDGLLITFRQYQWSSNAGDWAPLLKDEYEYTEAGLLSERIAYSYDSENEEFEPSLKEEFFYNDFGKQELYYRYSYSQFSEQFNPQEKVEFEYDSEGNVHSGFQYFNSLGEWEVVAEVEADVDYDILLSETIWPMEELEYDQFFTHAPTRIYTNYMEDKFEDEFESHYYYSPIDILSTAEEIGSEHRLYPNPGTGTFWLELPADWHNAQLRIFDLRGSMIHSLQLRGGQSSFELGHLSQGIYLYTIESEGRSHQGKLVKQ